MQEADAVNSEVANRDTHRVPAKGADCALRARGDPNYKPAHGGSAGAWRKPPVPRSPGAQLLALAGTGIHRASAAIRFSDSGTHNDDNNNFNETKMAV